ncbi:Zinc finger CCCH domain-containing protein 26 [Hibiscus syriacus]|uniref:Zinc finger CCCH domain-containing protein 26 n=1 Tax=Hibiscus syriacus TaxID=106335 RepID=A0A6A2ZD15_HIBSY|nr:Zinc finger CCCH domain-containing protein 26 [Hibiscus syriacus]
MLPYVHCAFRMSINKGHGSRRSNDFFALRDLIDLFEGAFAGACKYGSTCKYHHPKDRNGAGPVTFNILGLPMRQDEKSCPYFMRTGSCKFGVACKFHHPHPASPGAGLPVNGPAGSSVLPPTGVPYAGGLPTWSLPRAPFVSGPHLQTQNYMSVVVSPSQNIIPANGWSTYMLFLIARNEQRDCKGSNAFVVLCRPGRKSQLLVDPHVPKDGARNSPDLVMDNPLSQNPDKKIPLDVLVNMWVEIHNIDEEEPFAILMELSDKNLLTLVKDTRAGDAFCSYYEICVTQHDVLRDLAIHLSNQGSIV